MAVKPYTVEKEIRGEKYVFQFNGLSAALRAVDESYIPGTTNTSVEKLATYLFENVVVQPQGLTIDDFDSMEEFNEVISVARQVMSGDFRKEVIEKQSKGKGKE